MENKFPMIIGGEKISSEQLIGVSNPSNEQLVGYVFNADIALMEKSLISAKNGFDKWSSFTPNKRKEIILRYAEILEKNKSKLIELLILETGKPKENAEYDFGMLVTCLRFFVEEYERLDQPVIHDPDDRFLHYMQRQSVGVVVGFLAWNFPLLNLGYKLGPTLASGCSCILKPSELTPLATLEASYLANEAGIPEGVINVITCDDYSITNTLLESSIPSLVTMIGSTQGGIEVMNAACSSIKRFSVELGGNSPVIVYPDADIKSAAEKIVGLKYVNTGQVCVSPNRCFVHQSVYNQFIDEVLLCIKNVEMGPMITSEARDKVLSLIKSAEENGAEIIYGGTIVDKPGYFMKPTVIKDVEQSMSISSDEVFGPVLSIIPFSDNDDEIDFANNTSSGLAAYVFTTNLSKALQSAKKINAGSICINEPHYSVQLPHGGLKQSGVGKDCSRYSIEEYLTLKRVSILMEDK